MSDLIERQTAIDAATYGNPQTAWQRIEALPSAQPEKRTKKRTETHACDLVSRQAVIDAINEDSVLLEYHVPHTFHELKDAIKQLPSAQPEPTRCKDCKYYNTYYQGTESNPVITHLCQWFLDRTMEPDDFCSKAGRKEQ